MGKIGKAMAIGRYLAPGRDIEMFGMFGPGNLGDEAMLVAAEKTLGRDRVIPWMSSPRFAALDRLLQARKRTHLLVGGGTLIHGGNTGWLDHVERRWQQGMKVACFGTGMAFTQEQMAAPSPEFARWSRILADASPVMLRGPRSVATATRMGMTAEVFGDFAFLLHGTVPARRNTGNGFGINVGNCLGDQPAFEARMAQAVRALAQQDEITFYLVVESDAAATARIIAAAGLDRESVRIERHFFDPMAFMRAVQRHRGFIGLKMHAAGLAMVAGVPALMIGYLPKCQDFMAPLPDGEQALVPLDIAPQDIVDRLLALEGSGIPAGLETGIAALAARQRQILQDVYG